MARRQARRSKTSSSSSHGLLSFSAGVVCGLALATVAWLGGYLPRGDATSPGLPDGHDEPPIAQSSEGSRSRQYDFFTVLPEIEVVVPQREIEERAREREDSASSGPYMLQVGSFRSSSDAESLRAQLTLLGLDASIQSVTVNDSTWHRVRVGPYDGARDADGARRRLLENGYEAMVLTGD
jgi:cell division protein FtsN